MIWRWLTNLCCPWRALGNWRTEVDTLFVGERGPERLRFKRAARVVPFDDR